MVTDWIDTHAHLYADEFEEDIDGIIARAKEAGLSKILLPNIDLNSIGPLHALIDSTPDLFVGMMGLHPCSVDANYREYLLNIYDFLQQRNYAAVGEIGMDLYWDKSTRKWQEDAFCTQCEWASEKQLPIVVHSREATLELIEILEQNRQWNISGVFHCFTGSVDEAHRIIEMDFYLGIGGVVTFKNSDLRETLKQIPPERIVLETDSPYLAPVPFRGKRNESSYIPLIGETIAAVYEISTDMLRQITSKNARHIFSL